MKLLVFGNIASGKSTLCGLLQSKLPDFEYVSIDNYRRRFGDGTRSGELEALKEFGLSIKPGINQIIEAMGLGKTAELIASRIRRDEPVFMVILSTPTEVCLQRLVDRTEWVPYPDNRDKGEALLKLSVDRYKRLKEHPFPFHEHSVQLEFHPCETISQTINLVDSIIHNIIKR